MGLKVKCRNGHVMNHPRNVVGPQVAALRKLQKLSQPELAAKCQLIGWNVGRDTIAKIEDQRRWVGDFEIVGLSMALRVPMSCLYPSEAISKKLLYR